MIHVTAFHIRATAVSGCGLPAQHLVRSVKEVADLLGEGEGVVSIGGPGGDGSGPGILSVDALPAIAGIDGGVGHVGRGALCGFPSGGGGGC